MISSEELGQTFCGNGFIDVWWQFSYDSGCSVDMQHVGVQDACGVYSKLAQAVGSCTLVATGDAWGPNMACLLLHVVIAALTTGALGAPCPNSTVSFKIVASTLLLVCDVLNVKSGSTPSPLSNVDDLNPTILECERFSYYGHMIGELFCR